MKERNNKRIYRFMRIG